MSDRDDYAEPGEFPGRWFDPVAWVLIFVVAVAVGILADLGLLN